MDYLDSPLGCLIATAILFIILAARYFLFGYLLHWFFYVRKDPRWQQHRIVQQPADRRQFLSEMKWSMISSLIFAVAGVLLGILYLRGYTAITVDSQQLPAWYHPISLLMVMLLHEFYYYWIHRWMHRPRIYRMVHRVHHDSRITSPWTAFSFHPLEAIIQAAFLPLVLMLVPIHAVTLLVLLMIMTVSGFINHLGYEIYPSGFRKHILGKWVIGASHHARHHRQHRYNFGLYFNFLDVLFDTEAPAKK